MAYFDNYRIVFLLSFRAKFNSEYESVANEILDFERSIKYTKTIGVVHIFGDGAYANIDVGRTKKKTIIIIQSHP